MTYEEIMQALAGMGSEQTKNTYIRHGAKEPFFGVKIGDMKKLVKHVKKTKLSLCSCMNPATTMRCTWRGLASIRRRSPKNSCSIGWREPIGIRQPSIR